MDIDRPSDPTTNDSTLARNVEVPSDPTAATLQAFNTVPDDGTNTITKHPLNDDVKDIDLPAFAR